MGSAVFNIMVIVGVTAIFAGQVPAYPGRVRVTLTLTLTLTTDPNPDPGPNQVLDITPYPFARDCFFYTLSIAMLVAFVYDGKVTQTRTPTLTLTLALFNPNSSPDPHSNPNPNPYPYHNPYPNPNPNPYPNLTLTLAPTLALPLTRWRCGSLSSCYWDTCSTSHS